MLMHTCFSSWRLIRQTCSFVFNQQHVCKNSSLSTFTTLRTNVVHRDPVSSSESRTLSRNPGKCQYQLIEDVEDLQRYQPGGYHPLLVGDELDGGHYRLVDKLGYGGYSTTWLARDLQNAKYVAIKVVTADASNDSHETNILRLLGSLSSRPGRLLPLLDEFWVTGPNGEHRCMVTPPAQMSLFDTKEASTFGLLQPTVTQSIVAQLIHGVAFLHSQHIVHGDLHLGNILVQFPEAIDHSSTPELYERFGAPEPEAVVRLDGQPLTDGVPSRVYVPGWFGVRCDDLILGQDRIVLSDFGESFNPQKTPRSSSKTLPLLQPPEAQFSDSPLSFPSDIWTLACTIWEIFGRRPLFEAYFSTPDRVTAEQVEVLGILPPEWWKKWSQRAEWFNEEGELLKHHNRVRRAWEQRFSDSIQEPRAEVGLETVTKEERKAFEAMIRSMLAFRPEERATAQQLMHSEWMKGWGQPAQERSWGLAKSQ